MKDTLFNSTDILNKNRYAWADYARGIAIILVVNKHMLLGLLRSGFMVNPFLIETNDIVYNFRMPMFFILSGIFINISLNRKTPVQVVVNRLSTIMYPYLIWSFIQITVQIVFKKYIHSVKTLKDYTYILYNPHMIEQFWYLYALFLVTVIYVLVKCYIRPVWYVQILIGITLYYCSSFLNKAGQSPELSDSLLHDILYFYVFFAIGDSISAFMLDKENQNKIATWKNLLLIVPVFAVAQIYWHYHRQPFILFFGLIVMSGCVLLYICAFILDRYKVLKWLRVIGNHSLYIYIMHILVIATVRVIITNILKIDNVYLVLCIGVPCGIILPIIFYNLSIRAGLWFLYSLQKPTPRNKVAEIQQKLV